MDTIGTVTTEIGTETGIGMATGTVTGTGTGIAETIGAVPRVTLVGAREVPTSTGVPTMKIAAVIIDETMIMVIAEVAAKKLVRPIGAVAERGEGTASVLLKDDLQHLKALFHYLSESERHQDGMFTPPGMSNIRPCKRSRQVGFFIRNKQDRLIQTTHTGLFNLPGANRTQVPPILGIAGLPPPIPVQTFGMGIGSNPNLSRQSRRLYIGSITSDVNEQNLADFFNSKMIEMGIGTGGPGNPVLAVQCNYEKNYAFVEVSFYSSFKHRPIDHASSSEALRTLQQLWHSMVSYSSMAPSKSVGLKIMVALR